MIVRNAKGADRAGDYMPIVEEAQIDETIIVERNDREL